MPIWLQIVHDWFSSTRQSYGIWFQRW
jgi:hypothetical protein